MSGEILNFGIIKDVPLISPFSMRTEIPISEKSALFIKEARREICSILERKDNRFLLIAGPCSIHDTSAALVFAEKLLKLRKKYEDFFCIVMRVYFEKPRTVLGWRGLIVEPELDGIIDMEKGLKQARNLLSEITEMGLPAACEFLEPIVPQYISDFISWASIGARSAESQIHRELASGLSMPAAFKNATNGDIEPAVNGIIASRKPHAFIGISDSGYAAVMHTSGNPFSHLVLRGGSDGANCGCGSVLESEKILHENGVSSGILIDCSHGNSRKNPLAQPEILFNSLDMRFNKAPQFDILRGCMIESFLLEGSGKIENCRSKENFGRSITDPCISFTDLEKVLEKAYSEYSSFLRKV